MESEIKQKLFQDFLYEWGERFNAVYGILRYIDSYPGLGIRVGNYGRCKSISELEIRQMEWLYVVLGFEEKSEEKDFFKPYWVPMNNDSTNMYIDLSSETYALIVAIVCSNEPFRYHKGVIVNDIRDLLLSTDIKSIDLDAQRKANEEKFNEEVKERIRQYKDKNN